MPASMEACTSGTQLTRGHSLESRSPTSPRDTSFVRFDEAPGNYPSVACNKGTIRSSRHAFSAWRLFAKSERIIRACLNVAPEASHKFRKQNQQILRI